MEGRTRRSRCKRGREKILGRNTGVCHGTATVATILSMKVYPIAAERHQTEHVQASSH